MRRKLIFIAPLAVLAFIGFVAIGGAVVQLLWNWLGPAVFGWQAVSFWQALGILALCRILFGGFGGGGHRSGIRSRVRERFDGMAPEERERFREAMRKRWCRERPGESPNAAS
jgi:hypothetical protein